MTLPPDCPPQQIRTSTKFSMIVGGILIGAAVVIACFAVAMHMLGGMEIVSLISAFIIGGASFFGLNLGRITLENINGIKNGMNSGYGGGYGSGYGAYTDPSQTGTLNTSTTSLTQTQTSVSVNPATTVAPDTSTEFTPPVPTGSPQNGGE